MTVLTNFPFDPLLDLAPWVGQRQCTYRFERYNAVSKRVLSEIHPIRKARITHDTGRLIKRTLNMSFGVRDAEEVNTISDRIKPYMVFPSGTEYPLGTYMFTDESRQKFTIGDLANVTLNDEMYIIDQPLVAGIDANTTKNSATNEAAVSRINIGTFLADLFAELKLQFAAEPSSFSAPMAWPAGTMRGQVLEAIALAGDYFSPWFDNNNVLRFIRSFNPAYKIPDFNWDTGNTVMRDSIVGTSNLLNAPNRFLVISSGIGNKSSLIPIVGLALVPANAPHSFENRGFYITESRVSKLLTRFKRKL